MFGSIAKSYVELVDLLILVFRSLLLNLPRMILGITIFFVWMWLNVWFFEHIGYWGILVGFLTYMVPLLSVVAIYDKIIKRRANAVDPQTFIGNTYLDDPEQKLIIKFQPKYDGQGNRTYPLTYSTAKILDIKPEPDRKGNRIYLVGFTEVLHGEMKRKYVKEMPASIVYRNVITTKNWVPKTAEEFINTYDKSD